MDKNWKLQRYNRKDYTEVVDFPVEIVGRDGVVRRYTFEDSIRLYQRRITFAPIRYRDDELVDAEVVHCRSRIDQLRRSYFNHFGWGTPEGDPEPADVFEDLAGEVAAFICRSLHTEGRPAVRFTRVGGVDDNTASTWFVAPDDGGHGMLLYVHRFRGLTADAVRDRFFTFLRRLEMASPFAGDSERLLAFHHSADCGFVLTGRAEDFPEMLAPGARTVAEPAREADPTPWDEALELVRRGRHQEALDRCRSVVEDQPWHRRAYVAGAMVAMHLGHYEAAEDFALLGARYYPDDATLHYYAGVSRLHDGREEGEHGVRRALALAPEMTAARAALAVLLVERGDINEAAVVLRERPPAPPDDPDEVAMLRLHRWLAWRSPFLGFGVVLALVGVLGMLLSFAAIGVFGLAALLFVGHHVALHRQISAVRNRQHADEIRRGLRQLANETGQVAN